MPKIRTQSLALLTALLAVLSLSPGAYARSCRVVLPVGVGPGSLTNPNGVVTQIPKGKAGYVEFIGDTPYVIFSDANDIRVACGRGMTASLSRMPNKAKIESDPSNSQMIQKVRQGIYDKSNAYASFEPAAEPSNPPAAPRPTKPAVQKPVRTVAAIQPKTPIAPKPKKRESVVLGAEEGSAPEGEVVGAFPSGPLVQ